MLKIAVITSTRAEYGLLYPLIVKLRQEEHFELQLLVSGTHLLEKYGKTIRYIEEDGIPISYEIPIFTEAYAGDEAQAARAVGEAVSLCGKIFSTERYDAIILLGDRYELLGFCSAAVLCRIPIIHIHGGEITQGAIDDKIRHAVSKLASIHFPSVNAYAQRILQMGEDPQHVHVVGALGIDNIKSLELPDKQQLFQQLDIHTDLPVAAVTYHPVTGEEPQAALPEIRNVLEALLESGVFCIITMPNSDVGGELIQREILSYAQRHEDRIAFRKSLGQRLYLSLLKHADVMVGNSSSGILESASFGLPTVDIGIRQQGRMAPENVLHCECQKEKIVQTIRHALSPQFRESLRDYVNPYGDGHAAEKIVAVLKETDFSNKALICKKFWDIGKKV